MFSAQLRSRLSRSSAALRLGVAALVAIAFGSGLAPSAQASAPRAQHYYMALGASYAFGYQEAKFDAEIASNTYGPASFNTGYVDDFAHLLGNADGQLQTVNYSCPGETTQSFINGGCRFHLSGLSLHDD